MRRFLYYLFIGTALIGFGSCNNVDELDDLDGDGSASDTDSDADTDTDTDVDTGTDTDTDTDTDIDTETGADTDTDTTTAYDYDYEAVCCSAVPTTCADISDVTAEQEAGCCLHDPSIPANAVYYCSGGELQAASCSGFCGYDSGTEKMACLDIPFPAPCMDRDAHWYWDSEFPEFPVGTICCESLPATCAEIADTPEEQFVGCCEADTVHWCSGGELHSDPCFEGGTCAWADNGLMWCDAGFVATTSPCTDF